MKELLPMLEHFRATYTVNVQIVFGTSGPLGKQGVWHVLRTIVNYLICAQFAHKIGVGTRADADDMARVELLC